MRAIPLKTCRACGGDWFREADYYKFQRDATVTYWDVRSNGPDLVGQISIGPTTLLVCLCGTPLKPSIGGWRGGFTPNLELAQLLESLENCHAWLNGDVVLAAAEDVLAQAESIRVLAGQVKALERRAGRRMAQQTSSRKSPGGRYWAPPERKPASGDVLTLDTLVIALQKIGLTARDGKLVVKAMLAAIVDELKDGGIAKTPLGVFEIVRRPPERTLFRLGEKRKFNTKSKRVAFRPSSELRDACNRSIPTEIPVPVSNVKPDHQSCEKCGSIYFVECHFNQYRQGYSASPGGYISSLSEYPVKALVCLCGQPIMPGPRRRFGPGESENSKSFRKSLEAAWQYREHTGPKALLRKAAELYATKQQYDQLAERIAHLQTILREPLPPSPRHPRQPSNP